MPRMLDDECFRPSTASKRQTVNTGFKWTMLNEKSILFVYYHPACLRHIFLHTDIPFCGSTSPSPNIFGIVCLFVVKSVRARALATNLLIKHFTAPSAWMFGDVGMCLCFRVMAQTPPDGPQEACKTWKEKDILSVKHNETVPFVCFYLRGDFFCTRLILSAHMLEFGKPLERNSDEKVSHEILCVCVPKRLGSLLGEIR